MSHLYYIGPKRWNPYDFIGMSMVIFENKTYESLIIANNNEIILMSTLVAHDVFKVKLLFGGRGSSNVYLQRSIPDVINTYTHLTKLILVSVEP